MRDRSQDPGARLDELAAGLASLDDAPLATHPDALEAVHLALVAELDGLAGAAGADRTGA